MEKPGITTWGASAALRWARFARWNCAMPWPSWEFRTFGSSAAKTLPARTCCSRWATGGTAGAWKKWCAWCALPGRKSSFRGCPGSLSEKITAIIRQPVYWPWKRSTAPAIPQSFPQLAQPRKVNETLLEGLQPWQPQKIYFFSDASEDKFIKGKGPQYPTTAISPSHHMPYWRVSIDTFRFHLTQYRNYIEKLQSLNDEQLEKLAAADQDGWATPVELVFGKSLVQS